MPESKSDLERTVVRQLLHKATPLMEAVQPADSENFVRRVLTMTMQVWDEKEYLRKADPKSLVRAVTKCVALGLEPGVFAYLVPRKEKSSDTYPKVCLEIAGRGWVKMALDAGAVKRVRAEVVKENDHFSFDRARALVSFHHSDGVDERGPMIAVYAVATLPDGETESFLFDHEDIERAKARTRKATRSTDALPGPWVEEEGTAIAKMLKFMFKRQHLGLHPLLSKAIQADDAADMGMPPAPEVGPDALLEDPDDGDLAELDEQHAKITEAIGGSTTAH